MSEHTILENVYEIVLNKIKYIDKSIKSNTSYTMFLGPTGSGLSTLAKIQKGVESMQKFENNKSNIYVCSALLSTNCDYEGQPSVNDLNIHSSCIEFPLFYNVCSDFQNFFYLKKIFFLCKKLKVVVVAEYNLIFHERGKKFVDLIQTINRCTENQFEKHSFQFGLCVLNVPPNIGTENPNDFSNHIQKELKFSQYSKECIAIMRLLKDRLICVLEKETCKSIEKKLVTLLKRLNESSRIPMNPVLSPKGLKDFDNFVEKVFIDTKDNIFKSVNEYISNSKNAIRFACEKDFMMLMETLKKRNSEKRANLIKNALCSIKKSNYLIDLLKSIKEFVLNDKGTYFLSKYNFDQLLAGVDFISESFKMDENYILNINNALILILKLEKTLSALLLDLESIDKNWRCFFDISQTNQKNSQFAIGAGLVAGTGLALATGGSALVIGAIAAKTAISTATALGATGLAAKVLGSVGAYGTAGVASCFVGFYGGAVGCVLGCEAAEKIIGNKVIDENLLKNKLITTYTKLPVIIANIWITYIDKFRFEVGYEFIKELNKNTEKSCSTDYKSIFENLPQHFI